MKRFFSIIGLLSFAWVALPSVSLAATTYQCDEGTMECLCPPGLGVGDLGVDITDPETAEATCENLCLTASGSYGNPFDYREVTNFKIQCDINGQLTTIVDAPINKPESGLSESSFVEPPRLGIEIPGFDPQLSDSFFGGETFQSNILGLYVRAVYGWLISAGAIVAVLMIMIGGVQILMAGGAQGAIGQGRERIQNAVVGLVLLLSAYTIAFLIDPSTVTFDTLTLKYIDPVEYIALSNDLAGQLAAGPGTGNVPPEILCDPSYPLDEIAASTVGNITYRFGGKGGPKPYPAETKKSPNGTDYSSFCPEGTLCFDCSGYADFLRTCAGLPAGGEDGGTTGIFGEGCSNSEIATTWSEDGTVNGIALNPGDMVGLPGNHVLTYIGNQQFADSHGSGREPGEGVGIYGFASPFTSLFPSELLPLCVRRR